MAKSKTAYVCNDCGAEHTKWQGKCSACGKWNTLNKFRVGKAISITEDSVGFSAGVPAITPLVEIDEASVVRLATGINELDRVLGGGLVPGSVVLIGGEPGAGKSTLLLQMTTNISDRSRVLYISGEESLHQIAERARRLRLPLDGLAVAVDTRVEEIAKLVVKH